MDARLSINGLLIYDSSIFDTLQIPDDEDDNPLLNREILINTILMESAQLPVVFPDPVMFKAQVRVWSLRHRYTMDKLGRSLWLEYNPIENYDRLEESTDNTSNTGTQLVNSVDQGEVSAFDSNTMVPDTAGSRDSTTTNDLHQSTRRTSRIHGNIGVTTSQQMLMSERDVAMFDVYGLLADLFINEFCVRLY